MNGIVAAVQTALGTHKTPMRRADAAPVVVFPDFLASRDVADIVGWAAAHPHCFVESKVIALDDAGAVDTAHRRSRVLFDAAPVRHLLERRLLGTVDGVCEKLGLPKFHIAAVEMQVTASNHGDYFRCHSDNAHVTLAGRRLTYVYFFHREPQPYRGGQLRLYETSSHSGHAVRGDLLAEITPTRNTVVFFPSHYFHEVQTVHCPSREFLDSRFTINGWFVASVGACPASRIRRPRPTRPRFS